MSEIAKPQPAHLQRVTPEREALIEALASAALADGTDVMDAAEALAIASATVLIRSYAPHATIGLLQHLQQILSEAQAALRGMVQ